MTPATHLDGHYVIFGELISGMDVARKINALSKGAIEETVGPEAEVVVSDSGQLRSGTVLGAPKDGPPLQV